MRRRSYFPYLFFLVVLIGLLSGSERFSCRLRSLAICSLSPSWSAVEKTARFLSSSDGQARAYADYEELQRENQALHSQMEQMREWLLHEDRIEEQISRVKFLQSRMQENEWKNFFKRRYEQLASALELQLKSIPARVVFREPATWSSYLWLNVGEKQNRAVKQQIIAKNSPVVVGKALVGVVEEVFESQCKVRLITDANMKPAVRVARGRQQDHFLYEQVVSFIDVLETRRDLFQTAEERKEVLGCLQKIKKNLSQRDGDAYLAKGELHGSSEPLWRARGQRLKGLGFNYDFADREGPARDLRTGMMRSGDENSVPILQEGDLLVTSGLDGVFPMGLEVGVVTKVECLREGSCAYEIDALAVIDSLEKLNMVSVLPPLLLEQPAWKQCSR